MREAGLQFTSVDKGQFARYAKEVLEQDCPYALAERAVDRLVEKSLAPRLLAQVANELKTRPSEQRPPSHVPFQEPDEEDLRKLEELAGLAKGTE